MAAVAGLTGSGAEIATVHWRHRPHDAFASGEQTQLGVVELLGADGWRRRVRHVEEVFVLDVLQRPDQEQIG